MALTDEQIAQYAYNAGFRGADLAVAVALTHPESGGDPNAVQKGQPAATTGWGLWQITPGNQGLLDPQANANAAYAKYKAANGFSPWTTFVGGQYKAFLSAAQAAVAKITGATTSAANTAVTGAGTGLMAGQPVDPWGIAQGIADAAGYTGATLKAGGNQALNTGQVLIGILIVGVGVVILAHMFLHDTAPGRGIKRVGRDAVKTAAVVAK